jgi:hypothetical protein
MVTGSKESLLFIFWIHTGISRAHVNINICTLPSKNNYDQKTYVIVGLLADEAELAVDALPGLLVDPVRQVLGIVQTTRMH